MNIEEFFTNVKKDYGLTVREWCRAKNFCEATMNRYLQGVIPRKKMGVKIQKMTQNKVTLKDLGIQE